MPRKRRHRGEDSEPLVLDPGWNIACHRCANEGFCAADPGTPVAGMAAALFRDIGWRVVDGYQMCPSCAP